MRDFALFEKGDDDQKTPDGMVTVVEKSSASPMERFWYRPVYREIGSVLASSVL